MLSNNTCIVFGGNISTSWPLVGNLLCICILDMQLFRRIPNIRKSKSATVDISYFLGGCTYGGELAWLGGLARLSEISPSLGTLIKICVHMSSELARLGWISFDFAGIPPRWDENFPYEHAQVGQPGKVG